MLNNSLNFTIIPPDLGDTGTCNINAIDFVTENCTIYYGAVYGSYGFIVTLIILETLFIFLGDRFPMIINYQDIGIKDYNILHGISRVLQMAYFYRILYVWYLIRFVYKIV